MKEGEGCKDIKIREIEMVRMFRIYRPCTNYHVFVNITLLRRFLKAYFLPKLNYSHLTSLTYLRITYTLILLNFHVSIFW